MELQVPEVENLLLVEMPINTHCNTTRSGRVSLYPQQYNDYVSFCTKVAEAEGDLDLQYNIICFCC